MSIFKTLARELDVWEFAKKKKKKVNLSELILFHIMCLKN